MAHSTYKGQGDFFILTQRFIDLQKLEIEYFSNTAERLTDLVELSGFVFLDSCFPLNQDGRYDIVSACPRIRIHTAGLVSTIETKQSTFTSSEDPLAIVQDYLGHEKTETTDLPFYGGAIGMFSYDLGRRLECLPSLAARDLDVPENACWDLRLGCGDRSSFATRLGCSAG